MNTDNPKTESEDDKTTVRILTDEHDVRHSEFTISEDDDAGGDPYNNTGQHVVLKSKLELSD